jgi:hypothetical protein
MADGPKQYHPASYDENSNYIVDTFTVVEGYQVRPDTWLDVAVWCGGMQFLDSGNQAVMVGGEVAQLGDFVMCRDGVFHVEPADGHYQRWSPV